MWFVLSLFHATCAGGLETVHHPPKAMQERLGCVSAIKGEDLDLGNASVSVGGVNKKTTPRVLPLAGGVVQILKAAREGLPWRKGIWVMPTSGFVFTADERKGGKHTAISRAAVHKVIKAAREGEAKAHDDLSLHDIRGHTGRGTAIKQMLQSGVTPEAGCLLTGPWGIVQPLLRFNSEVLNQMSISMTMSTRRQTNNGTTT
jgi:integrase